MSNESIIEACVVSWTGQHENAVRIARGLRTVLPAVSIVYSDADPHVSLPDDVAAVRVPDDWFWGRKFELALRSCESELLLIVQADASTDDWGRLVERCVHCFATCQPTGVWAPLVDYTPHSLDRTLLGNVGDDSLKIVSQTDGIVFAINRAVQDRLRQLRFDENTYGWGIDWAAIAFAYANRMLAIVDASVPVRHPRSRGYDSGAAMRQMEAFLRQLDPFESLQYMLLSSHQNAPRAGVPAAAAAAAPLAAAPAPAPKPVAPAVVAAAAAAVPAAAAVVPAAVVCAAAVATAAVPATAVPAAVAAAVAPATGPKLIVHDSRIDYADGSERALLSIVSSPQFSEDTSWRDHAGEWPLYYHLSPLRGNLFGMLDLSGAPLDVLELGAGCGAITSALARHRNLRVTAVEGAIDRARVIEARCRSASNLEIHACDIGGFEPDRRFDVVTLIGVLEYAGRYSKQEAPFDWLLARARRLLKDDGVLVLAIENQIGHKYLAGSPEDHYGTPFEGINGYPNYNGVMTFDRAELAEMLERNGFGASRWFYPYPDYKMPVLLFSQAGLDDPSFDWIPMTQFGPEPNMIAKPAFDEMEFMRKMRRRGACGEFMNSFCVVAGALAEHVDARIDSKLLGLKTTVKHRAPRFGIETRFERDDDGGIVVVKSPSRDVPAKPHRFITHVNRSRAPYYPNSSTLHDIVARALRAGRPDEARAALSRWWEVLSGLGQVPTQSDVERFVGFCRDVFGHTLYAGAVQGPWVDGAHFDLIPSNIVILNDGSHRLIDLEWQLAMRLPVQFVIDHGLVVLSTSTVANARHTAFPADPSTGLIAPLVQAARATPLMDRFSAVDARQFITWFEGGVFHDLLDETCDEVADRASTPDAETFISRVASMVQGNRGREALAYAQRYRSRYPDSEIFRRFDPLMVKLRESLEA